MEHSPRRRALLLAAASVPFAAACTTGATSATSAASPVYSDSTIDDVAVQKRFAALEASVSSLGGRLGVAALNTSNGARLGYHADDRFPLCSTSKVMIVSAILRRGGAQGSLQQRRIMYAKDELVTYSPITERHVSDGMTVASLCQAALWYSDNTAANLLMKILGGPAAVTAFARSIGDESFQLDRWEPALNDSTPDDSRDTTTPAAMVASLQRLALGMALGEPERAKLIEWMWGSQTGVDRIRAGLPRTWSVVDKTGTGDYGTTNDVAVVWPPKHPPIVLAVYFTQRGKDASPRNDVVADAARIVADTMVHRQ